MDKDAFVIDISRGGIGIGSPNEMVSEGDRVSVEIVTLSSRERWTLSGTVRHRKFDKSRHAWCFGVQFDRLISEDEANGIPQTNKDIEDADDLVDLLNLMEAEAKTARPS